MPIDTAAILCLPDEPLDPAKVDEFAAYADERHEIVGALHVPAGTLPADFAEFCRDVLDAVLEVAGWVEPTDDELRLVMAHLPATDLVLLARGGSLPADHSFFAKLRGEAA